MWNPLNRFMVVVACILAEKCDLHSADFNLLRIINPDPRALLAPQAPKRFFSMVPGTFQKLWGNDFQKVPKVRFQE